MIMGSSISNFFASKKTGIAVALLACLAGTLSLTPFLPALRADLRAVCPGLSISLTGFYQAYSDDVKEHGGIGKEIPTRIFFFACVTCLVILIAIAAMMHFSKQ